MRVKVGDAWASKATPFDVGAEADAMRYAAEAQRLIDGRRSGPPTITGLPAVKLGDFGWVVHLDATAPAICWYADDAIGSRGTAYCSSSLGDPDRWSAKRADLRDLPVWFEPPVASLPSTGEGWLYAIALTPDADLRRIKIGWTSKLIGNRLKSYRTANPGAMLLALWDADRDQELAAHAAVDGRIGASEVFQCADPWSATTAIGAALRGSR